MADLLSVEFSAVEARSDSTNSVVLMTGDVTSESLRISDTKAISTITSTESANTGMGRIINTSRTLDCWVAVGQNPDPTNPAKRRWLGAREKIDCSVESGDKVAVIVAK